MAKYAPDDKALTFIPFDDVMKAGSQRMHADVLTDYWWVVHPEKGLVLLSAFGRKHPVANHNEGIARRQMLPFYDEWAEVRQIPLVILPHNYRDYFE